MATHTTVKLVQDIGLVSGVPRWIVHIGLLALVAGMAVALMGRFGELLRQESDVKTPTPALGSIDGSATTAELMAMSTLGSEAPLGNLLPVPKPGVPTGDLSDLATGARIGRYVVLDRLGRGGMGVVYRAHDPELARFVAIKLVAGGGTGSSGARRQAMLQREAVAMAQCVHSNVVTIFDVGICADRVFIAMEYLQGETLRSWLKTPRALPDILHHFRRAARGLRAAHRAGIVHGDFKPANVMCARGGHVVVVDFDIARITEDGARGLGLGGAGTPTFMAPEIEAGGRATAASDQYAFCVALFQALYGVHPREVAADHAELRRAVEERVIEPSAELPDGLSEALLQGMSQRPEDRFPTMEPLMQHARAYPATGRPFAKRRRARVPRAPEPVGVRRSGAAKPSKLGTVELGQNLRSLAPGSGQSARSMLRIRRTRPR